MYVHGKVIRIAAPRRKASPRFIQTVNVVVFACDVNGQSSQIADRKRNHNELKI